MLGDYTVFSVVRVECFQVLSFYGQIALIWLNARGDITVAVIEINNKLFDLCKIFISDNRWLVH